jgi:hypothetical protein
MTLPQKLLIKAEKKWLIYNPPKGYVQSLKNLLKDVTCTTIPKGEFDGIQLFAKNKSELASSLKIIAPLLKPDTIFWITYPKRSSGIKSDMKMGDWDELSAYKLKGVSSISVSEEWAGSRFRPEGQSKRSGTGKDEIRKSDYAAYIDVDTKSITLPIYIRRLFKDTPEAFNIFQKLSYSNKKDYLLWIFTAKQEKTRSERLAGFIEKLLAGKRNPYAK